MRIKETLAEIEPYVGGPSKRDVSQKYGLSEQEIIKLSNNENPLGVSKRAVEAVRNIEKSALSLYPERYTIELREVLAEQLSVSQESLIFGVGCDEILQIAFQTLLEKGDELVVPYPSFPFYDSILKPLGVNMKKVPLKPDFSFDVNSFVKASQGKNALVCNPNSPTGTLVSLGDLEKVLQVANCLILDETYYLFSGQSAISLLGKYDNLFICRSLSKDYGLTGLRIGYGVGSPVLIWEMGKIKLPYNINNVSEKAAVAALRDREFIGRSIRLIEEGRRYLSENLESMGYRTFPSAGNFVLVQTGDSKLLVESLLEKGISIRDYGRFEGFDGEYVRISVGTSEQNKRLVEVLNQLK